MANKLKEIKEATLENAKPLEDFLAFNNGENYRELAKSYIECMFSQDYRKPVFLIAVEDEKIIGAAAYSEELFTVSTWGISWVSVHPEKRNRGLGEALVKSCLVEINNRVQKTVTVILATYPGQTGLYERLDFKISGHGSDGGCFMTKILLHD